jgi:hypothetical protein
MVYNMPKLCEFDTCRNRATYGLNRNPLRCFQHKENNMELSCTFCHCGKAKPIFNLEGLKPEYCASCKTNEMTDVSNKKCHCGKARAYYNFEGLKPNYCASCKTNEMINLVRKKCHCGKARPTYNIEGLKPEYCASCKTNEMTDVGHKKCNCGKGRPFYNIEGLKPEYCSSCKTKDMKNVANKKCHCGNAIPVYNIKGLKPEYCASCKTNEMTDVVSKKCHCTKAQPSYNFEGLKPEYCVSCKTNEMIDVKNKKCHCGKAQPNYNFEGLQPKYCLSCKKNGMVDIVHDSCKAENCQTRGNKNYKGYCANCFQHLFPTDPLTFQIRSKTKEIAVRDFINSRFEGFQHDKPLWYNETACDCTTKRRIDHRKLINDTLLCIETDENQHKSYSKEDEIARYNDLFMAFGGKFIFIRFNPDKYTENGKSRNPMLVNRLPVLETEINKQIKRIETNENSELLEVIELYYDKNK